MILNKKLFYVLIACFYAGFVNAQNETNKWYFGNHAGLDFTTTPPATLNNSAMNTMEGCASIADASGNLLFYTDGQTVWDQTHSIMANGSGLLGNGPSQTAQAAIIIKQPNSSTQYFIFHLDDFMGPDGLRYSLVDMSLAAGMGSVTTKNVLLKTPSSEALSAARHCNGSDVWVISHDTDNVFRTFLVTSSGVNTVAVVSTFPPNGIEHNLGSIKVSPNGKKIALTTNSGNVANVGGFDLYDFDNTTGIVSNRIVLYAYPWSSLCEFSPDGTKLYGTHLNGIFQWDLCQNHPAAIIASKYAVINNSNVSRQGIQMASDGRIYVARYTQPELGIIQNPNAAGVACNYIDQGLTITSGTVMFCLPNFSSSYFFTKPAFPFGTTISCLTASFTPLLCSYAAPDIVSVKWDFGDTASGAQNTSTVSHPTHVYSAAGTYTVQLIRHYTCYSDTILQPMLVTGVTPILSVSGPTTICLGETISYSVSGADTFTWSVNSPTVSTTQLLFSPTATGSFSFTVTGTNIQNQCSSIHSFQVKVSGCNGLATSGIPGLSIYPNPTHGILYIQTVSSMEISIYDQSGTILLNEKIKPGEQKIDLGSFKTGVYYLKARNTTTTPYYQRIIKID